MDTKVLENPIVRIVAAFGLLLAFTDVLVGLFFGLFRLLGIFEFGAFERLWNVDRTTWFTMLVVLGAWIGISLVAKFEPLLMGAVAGAYFVWMVFVRNIAFDLPDFLRDLFFVVEPLLALIGVGLGFLTLLSIKAPMDLSTRGLDGVMGATPFGAASTGNPAPPAPGAPSPAAPEPAAQTPAAPTPEPAAASTQEPGWFPDPKGEATYRWWDGSAWTDNTHEG